MPSAIVPMAEEKAHLGVLDGWRGISILLVLAAHLLPLGPKAWRLNETAGPMGMAIFFALSGFLITRFLLERPSVPDFLVRRFFRIVPLAWLSLVVVLPLTGAKAEQYLPNFLFYANLPPFPLTEVAGHFWSLCVEMQFYVAVALIVALLGRRGLMFLPVLCLAVTLLRIVDGAMIEIVTWHRVDEILAGATLALIHAGKLGQRTQAVLRRTSLFVVLPLFAVSSHPDSGFMNYLRPYFSAALVGCTLFEPDASIAQVLKSRLLAYLAKISFALYVFHGLFMHSWLGDGERLAKYLKRPLLIAAAFAAAHLSTVYYEQRWIDLGKRLSRRGR